MYLLGAKDKQSGEVRVYNITDSLLVVLASRLLIEVIVCICVDSVSRPSVPHQRAVGH